MNASHIKVFTAEIELIELIQKLYKMTKKFHINSKN